MIAILRKARLLNDPGPTPTNTASGCCCQINPTFSKSSTLPSSSNFSNDDTRTEKTPKCSKVNSDKANTGTADAKIIARNKRLDNFPYLTNTIAAAIGKTNHIVWKPHSKNNITPQPTAIVFQMLGPS